MDPNTGRLRALSSDEFSMLSMMEDAAETVVRGQRRVPDELKGLEPLPEELNKEAEKVLNGKKETYVDLKSDSPLAKWAQKRRKASAAKKKKKRRKMAKQSQKTNRNK